MVAGSVGSGCRLVSHRSRVFSGLVLVLRKVGLVDLSPLIGAMVGLVILAWVVIRSAVWSGVLVIVGWSGRSRYGRCGWSGVDRSCV